MTPMTRVLHAGRGALVLQVDGPRALIWSAGFVRRWVPIASLRSVGEGPPQRHEEASAERESQQRYFARLQREHDAYIRELEVMGE